MPQAIIRPITDQDDDILRRCHLNARYGELDHLGWNQEQKDLFLLTLYERQYQMYRIHYDWSQFGIIQYQEQDAGCLLVNDHKDYIELIDFTLLPEFRGLGLAKQVIAELKQQATEQQKQIRMMLLPSNCGFDFYLKVGFEKTELQGEAWLLTWQPATLAKP